MVVVGRFVGVLLGADVVANRLIYHDGRCGKALIDCGRVQYALEERTELTIGLRRPVELTALEFVATHHGENPTRPILDHQEGALRKRLLVQLGFDGRFCELVPISVGRVECRDFNFDQIAGPHELVGRCASDASEPLGSTR